MTRAQPRTAAPDYSGTPLARKLGIGEGARVVIRFAPREYTQWLRPLPAGVTFGKAATPDTDVVHVFAARKAVLADELAALRGTIRPDGVVWASWPKKAANVPTDVTEQTIRDVALPLGFVDIKVCAVSDVWSGLKLVIRKNQRRVGAAG